jgi:hypothetical protein
MMHKTTTKISAPRAFAVLLALASTLHATVPAGWYLAGSRPASYETGTDEGVLYEGQHSAYLKSKEPVQEGFGTLMQDFNAGKYAGKRVRLSATVKSEAVQDWAGLWMRVDKGSQIAIAFDNMQNRPIRGTTDWKPYEVVLDVPEDATGIAFGILLSKTGAIWMSNVKFEMVDSSVPTTGTSHHEEPVNLGFEEN